MRGNTIRKFVIALIIIVPVFSYTGCKKQSKCGCGKDVLYNFTQTPVTVIFNDSYSIMYFQTQGDPYSTYNFCNPSEMIPSLANSKSGDILQVSGHVYWNCNFVYQSSNSSYQSMYKVYDVQATELYQDLYGKSKPASDTQLNSATPQK